MYEFCAFFITMTSFLHELKTFGNENRKFVNLVTKFKENLKFENWMIKQSHNLIKFHPFILT